MDTIIELTLQNLNQGDRGDKVEDLQQGMCVAVCCSVLQCVAVCCSVLKICNKVCVLQFVAIHH